MVAPTGKLFAVFVTALAMSTKADYLLFDPPDLALPDDVSLANGHPDAVNLATIMKTVAFANKTYWPDRLKADGSKLGMCFYGNNTDTVTCYDQPMVQASEQIELWSKAKLRAWPATVIDMLFAAGVEVYSYQRKKDGVLFQSWVDDKSQPIRNKPQKVDFEECLKRLFGEPLQSQVDTAEKFKAQIADFEEDSGTVVLLETVSKAKNLKSDYLYGLVKSKDAIVYLTDPAEKTLVAWWKLEEVVQEIKLARIYTPGRLKIPRGQ